MRNSNLTSGVPRRPPPSLVWICCDLARRIATVAALMTALLALAFFPWASDAPLTAAQQTELQRYYAAAYAKQDAAAGEPENSAYVVTAEWAAKTFDIKGGVAGFVRDHGLEGKKVLDVGAGRGYLQDAVEDYTGLDISPSARRFFHKRFVLGSATAMPFPDNEFDGAWSIWVLEHVPNPEAALSEMRRVVKDGGLIYLRPAWDCTPWAAAGYPVRPFGDFGLGGRLIKVWIPVHDYLWLLSKAPVRLLRQADWKAFRGPTRFRYKRLTPNYEHYRMPDSDAVSSLDRYETALWFLSRGDECVNCAGISQGLMTPQDALIIRVRKGPAVKSFARTAA